MSDNFNKLKHVFIRNWKSIFESIPLSIAIIVSFYTIMVEDITTKTQQELFSYIIMILGLLAFATLIERFLSLKEITQLCKETNDYLIEREMKPNLDSIIFDLWKIDCDQQQILQSREVPYFGLRIVIPTFSSKKQRKDAL